MVPASELFATVVVIQVQDVDVILSHQVNHQAAPQLITQASVHFKAYQLTAGIATGRV
jgi:hypothetical protein